MENGEGAGGDGDLLGTCAVSGGLSNHDGCHDHAWQNDFPGAADRISRPEDCCGFWITTPGRHGVGAGRLTADPGASPGHVLAPAIRSRFGRWPAEKGHNDDASLVVSALREYEGDRY